MKNIDDIIVIRARQYDRIRKAQMVIAIIDATVTTDERYVAQVEDKYAEGGDVAVAFPTPHDLGDNPNAMFN
jgi:hypothetical protein